MNPYALLDPAVSTLHHLLVQVASAAPLPAEGARLAVALAVVTIAVRALLLPLSVRALRAQQRRAALAPHLVQVRRRHRDDPQRLLAEMSRVHRDAGVSPAAGLLPMLAQLPVIATLYRLVTSATIAGAPNVLLSAHLFGAPMAAHWPEVVAAGGLLGPGTVALLVLVAGLLFLAAVTSRDAARQVARPGVGAGSDGAAADPTAAAVSRILRLLPFTTVVLALLTPVAMGVYLLVTTAWTVAERRALPRLLPA